MWQFNESRNSCPLTSPGAAAGRPYHLSSLFMEVLKSGSRNGCYSVNRRGGCVDNPNRRRCHQVRRQKPATRPDHLRVEGHQEESPYGGTLNRKAPNGRRWCLLNPPTSGLIQHSIHPDRNATPLPEARFQSERNLASPKPARARLPTSGSRLYARCRGSVCPWKRSKINPRVVDLESAGSLAFEVVIIR